MKPLGNLILFACFVARSAFAEDPAKPIQDLILDDHRVYAVPMFNCDFDVQLAEK